MNHLDHLKEFEDALRDYHVSAEVHQTLADNELALMLAPTSAGRNTIIRELLDSGHYYYIISDTTREPRFNDGVEEQNGVEYWFRSEEDMLADVNAGKFIEAEIIHGQQVSGMSIRELEKARDSSKIGITDVDIAGVDNVTRVKPDTLIFLILPPNFKEWQRRIHGRGEMKPAEFKNRMVTAQKIFALAADDRFNIVINDDLHEAVKSVDESARFKRINLAVQAQGRQLAKELLDQTIELIGTLD